MVSSWRCVELVRQGRIIGWEFLALLMPTPLRKGYNRRDNITHPARRVVETATDKGSVSNPALTVNGHNAD